MTKKQQDINREEQRFGDGFDMPSMEELEKIKIRNMIDRYRSRHISKHDKAYLKYKIAFFSKGKFIHFHYPFRGLTKDEIVNYLSNSRLPYTDIFII